MAKRKNSESANPDSCAPAGAALGGYDATGPLPLAHSVVQLDRAAEELGLLSGEVQSFLSARAELARKLALEIDATEKRLAELKRTVALLFPAECACQTDKERHERKFKKTSPGRTSKSDREVVDDKQLRIEAMDVDAGDMDAATPEDAHGLPPQSAPRHVEPPPALQHQPVQHQTPSEVSPAGQVHYSIHPPHPPRSRLSVPRRKPSTSHLVAKRGSTERPARRQPRNGVRRSATGHLPQATDEQPLPLD